MNQANATPAPGRAALVNGFLLVTTNSGRALINLRQISDIQTLERPLPKGLHEELKTRIWFIHAAEPPPYIDVKDSVEDIFIALDQNGLFYVE